MQCQQHCSYRLKGKERERGEDMVLAKQAANREQTGSGEDRGPGMQPRETHGRLGGLSYHIVFLVQPPAHEYG